MAYQDPQELTNIYQRMDQMRSEARAQIPEAMVEGAGMLMGRPPFITKPAAMKALMKVGSKAIRKTATDLPEIVQAVSTGGYYPGPLKLAFTKPVSIDSLKKLFKGHNVSIVRKKSEFAPDLNTYELQFYEGYNQTNPPSDWMDKIGLKEQLLRWGEPKVK